MELADGNITKVTIILIAIALVLIVLFCICLVIFLLIVLPILKWIFPIIVRFLYISFYNDSNIKTMLMQPLILTKLRGKNRYNYHLLFLLYFLVSDYIWIGDI